MLTVSLLGCSNMFVNCVGKTQFAVILRFIANDFSGVHQTPIGMRVATDPIKNLKRDATLVLDRFGFDTFDVQLNKIPLAGIDRQRTTYLLQISQLAVFHIGFAWSSDANVNVLQLSSLHTHGTT